MNSPVWCFPIIQVQLETFYLKNGRLNKGIELPQNRNAFLELSFEDANGVAIKGAIP